MHTVKINIQDSVFDKVIYFLNNLPSDEVKIVDSHIIEDWADLEAEIDKGLASGVSDRSHEEIINDIKSRYV